MRLLLDNDSETETDWHKKIYMKYITYEHDRLHRRWMKDEEKDWPKL
jgi:hypothetical protein